MKKLLQTLFFFLLAAQICFAQWYPQNSGTTKNLNDVVFIDANVGIAVGDSGIILRTTNGGSLWSVVPTNDYNKLTSVSFVDGGNGWVSGQRMWGGILYSDSSVILRTIDSGLSWYEQTKFDLDVLNDVFFVDQNTGFIVGDFSDVFRTTDGGETWSGTILPNPIQQVYFVDNQTGWIVGRGCGMILCTSWIYRTTDGGNSWQMQMEELGPALHDISFTDAQNGIAVGDLYLAGVVYRTTDGGGTWVENLGSPFGETTFVDVFHITNSVAVMWGTDPNYNFNNKDVFYQSTNRGETWELQGQQEYSLHHNRLFFTDASNGWVVADSGIILHTTNGGLPVELTSFTAKSNGKEVILNWSTATELNNQGFEIQRRVAESEFATIGFVKGEGTTTNQKEYSYIDKELADVKYFYRLKQIDYNGTYEYSNVIEVDVRSLNEYALEQNYPNPFNPVTTIGYVLKDKSNAKLILLNAIGEEVAVLVNEEQDKGFHTVDFNAANLPSGVYFYQLKAGEFISVKKMLLLK